MKKDNITLNTNNITTNHETKESEDPKEKLNSLTNKYISVRKEKDQLKKENKELQNEILILQSNIRQMIPGFSSNTSSSFPMLNELQNKLSEYYKCECQDIFFDLLCPELNMDGLVFYFQESFNKIQEMINQYYDPLEILLKKTICIDDMWSSIDNVLRKSYQSNWKKILNQIFGEISHNNIMLFIQNNLKLQEEDITANTMIVEFLKKTAVILFFCHISDPIIKIDIASIGQTVSFNPIKHETIDGFAKPKQECIILLPSCYKTNLNFENMIIKSQVLPVNYEFP
jgi:FtsZ-binding cell division protein ZapB